MAGTGGRQPGDLPARGHPLCPPPVPPLCRLPWAEFVEVPAAASAPGTMGPQEAPQRHGPPWPPAPRGCPRSKPLGAMLASPIWHHTWCPGPLPTGQADSNPLAPTGPIFPLPAQGPGAAPAPWLRRDPLSGAGGGGVKGDRGPLAGRGPVWAFPTSSAASLSPHGSDYTRMWRQRCVPRRLGHGTGMARLWEQACSVARHGTARHGHGMAERSRAWHGTARHDMARHGMAGHGTARHGVSMPWHSTARHAGCTRQAWPVAGTGPGHGPAQLRHRGMLAGTGGRGQRLGGQWPRGRAQRAAGHRPAKQRGGVGSGVAPVPSLPPPVLGPSRDPYTPGQGRTPLPAAVWPGEGGGHSRTPPCRRGAQPGTAPRPPPAPLGAPRPFPTPGPPRD